jgi:hypothetical protein
MGKSTREIGRCLKRAVARQLFKLLERCDRSMGTWSAAAEPVGAVLMLPMR